MKFIVLNFRANGFNGQKIMSIAHVFFHPALCMAWLETYRPIRKLEPLFCIGDSNHNHFFLPLVLWRKNWKNAFQKVIVPVGYSDFDYHEPYCIGNSDIRKGVKCINMS